MPAKGYFPTQEALRLIAPEDAAGFSNYLIMLERLQPKNLDPALSTPSYHHNTEPDVMALMLVAAHEEMDFLGQALEQYAAQEGAPSSRILLYLNWPPGKEHEHKVAHTAWLAREFIRKNPQVPLAFFGTPLPSEAPISSRRKLLWDVALYDIRSSQRTDDVLLLNHDADITYLDPHHFASMRAAFDKRAREPAMAVYPYTHHQTSNGLLPNLDAVVSWYDFENSYFRLPFEAGSGVSARAYMSANGFDVNNIGEFHSLVDSFYPEGVRFGQVHVPHAEVRHSARRLYNKLLDGYPTEDFWTHDEGFSDRERYRTLSTSDIRDLPLVEAAYHIRRIICHGPNNFFGAVALDAALEQGSVSAGLAHARRVMHAGRILLGGGDTIRIPDDKLDSAFYSYTASRVKSGELTAILDKASQ